MDGTFKIFLVPLAVAIGTFFVLVILRGIAFKLLHKWADKTHTKLDDIVIVSLKLPSLFWCLAIGLYLGVAVSSLPEKYLFYITKTIYVVIVFSITLVAANLSAKIFRNYIQSSNLPVPTTGLFYGLLKGIILIIGFLIILSILGVSITPLITALGVGGLAVALALQDTLANLFAGLHILVERSIRVGDFIRLETGQEGYVEDITWRTTRIRMLPNNIVVIPNSKLSQSIVTNYYLPEKRMAILIPVSVSYASDPEKIEKLLLDIAESAIGKIDGLLSDPKPAVRFIPGFGDSSLDFTLICHVREFTDQFPVQHEIRKLIFKRFREEGIEIPFPQRVVHLKQ